MGDRRATSDSDTSGGQPVKITVVDRRHHAEDHADAGGSGAERSPYPSVVEEMKARAEDAEARARESMARAEAEIEAVRERLHRDVERRVARGKAPLLESMLEIVDNLERAAASARAESTSIAEGIEIVHQQLLGILRQEGVQPIETLGADYDPEVAEAIGLEQVGAEQDNKVVEEVLRGYRLEDTILRHARVKVGKASG